MILPNQNNINVYGWPSNPLAFLLLSRFLYLAFISFPRFFQPVARSTSRCRQLATRGLGCDHKRINPSDGTRGIRRRCLAERSRMAMSVAAGRRRGNNVAEFIRILFFSPPGWPASITNAIFQKERSRRLYSDSISRCLEGIDRPSRMNAILSQFSSASVLRSGIFFSHASQFYKLNVARNRD